MTTDANTHTMHIGELAERTQLSLRTIRHYDEVGLLKPQGRTEGGFRLYSKEDVEQLLLIRRMKPLGFSIEEMHELLGLLAAKDASGPESEATRKLLWFRELATARREKLVDYLKRADELIKIL